MLIPYIVVEKLLRRNVMEQLTTLWQYQEQDLYMDKLNRQRKSLPLRNKLIKLRDIIYEQQSLLHKLNEDLEKETYI